MSPSLVVNYYFQAQRSRAGFEILRALVSIVTPLAFMTSGITGNPYFRKTRKQRQFFCGSVLRCISSSHCYKFARYTFTRDVSLQSAPWKTKLNSGCVRESLPALVGNLLKDVVIWELFPENFFLAEASLEPNCQRKEIYNTFLVTLGSVKY